MKFHLSRTRVRVAAAVLLVLAALAPALAPTATEAVTGQEPSAEEQQADVRRRQGEVALEVDVLAARNNEIAAALATLDANVTTQAAEVDEAERASEAAQQDLTDAEEAVAAAEARIDELNTASNEFAVDSYMHPPTEDAFDALSAETISDATIKQAILDIQSSAEADVLDQLEEAHEDVEIERDNKEQVADEAETKRQTAADELSELQAAQEQQRQFAAEAEAALDQKLTESANLAELDKELSDQIAAEQAALARQLAAAAAANGGSGNQSSSPGSITPAPGGLSTVSCSTGGSITVAGEIAGNLRSMLDAAAADGVGLCGGGWRDPQQQISLRRAHCGSSDYAIWNMPSSQCSPPTARPGYSQHEVGLAIDFTCNGGGSISSHSSPCFQWLDAHASDYGFYNLPSEPWHWSTTGR
jgi:LAS superfamily LD-carboxypeptidase LdcB